MVISFIHFNSKTTICKLISLPPKILFVGKIHDSISESKKTGFLFDPLSDFNVNAETTTPCPLLIKEGSYMFVFGLIEVARDFVSEMDLYPCSPTL